MATAKKKPAKKKKKTKFSPWLIFIFILIIIVALAMGISYYLTNSKNPTVHEWANSEETAAETKSNEKTTKIIEKTPLEGSWVSYYDGAILTFTGLDFVLELPSVDSPEKIKGKIAIESTIVTFYYSSGKKSCLDVEGHYQFSFIDEELNFKVIKDLCNSRKERMSANWFKL